MSHYDASTATSLRCGHAPVPVARRHVAHAVVSVELASRRRRLVDERKVGRRRGVAGEHCEAAYFHRSARRPLDAKQGSLDGGRGAAAIRKVPAEAAEPPAVLEHRGRVVLAHAEAHVKRRRATHPAHRQQRPRRRHGRRCERVPHLREVGEQRRVRRRVKAVGEAPAQAELEQQCADVARRGVLRAEVVDREPEEGRRAVRALQVRGDDERGPAVVRVGRHEAERLLRVVVPHTRQVYQQARQTRGLVRVGRLV
eukprot:scaffold72776_cov69-Phaeocystis_antarctica.AAC.6